MKILQTEIYEESKVILKLGEDFTRCQLDDFSFTFSCPEFYLLISIKSLSWEFSV